VFLAQGKPPNRFSLFVAIIIGVVALVFVRSAKESKGLLERPQNYDSASLNAFPAFPRIV
jgi:hypothetical protein